MINEKMLKKLSQLQKKKSNELNYSKCSKHQKYLSKICITCKMDICPECEKDHAHHYMIKQEEIKPEEEEIKTLEFGIQNYISDSTELLNEIRRWQKDIHDKILLFESNMKNNLILNSIDFINTFRHHNISLNSTIKFRKIYSWIIEPDVKSKNNKVLSFLNEDNYISKQKNVFESNNNYNLNYNLNYEYNDYLEMKHLLKEINILKDNYIKKNTKILKYLIKKYTDNSKISTNQKLNIKQKRSILRGRNIQEGINRINIENRFNKSYDNFNSKNNKLNRTYTPKSMNGERNSSGVLSNGSLNEAIYSKKSSNLKSQANSNILRLNLNNINSNSNNSKHVRYHSSRIMNPKKFNTNSTNSDFSFNSPISHTNQNNNYVKSFSEIDKNKNIVYSKKGKTYVRKKQKVSNQNNKIMFNKGNLNSFVQIENSIDNKLSESKKSILNKSDTKIGHNISPSKFKNLDLSQPKINNIINIPISFSNNSNNNEIKKALFDKLMNINLNDFNNKNDYNIKILKPFKNEFFKIGKDKKLYLGLDLGNVETKIGIIKNYNEIQLMCFSDNKYSIPTMVSFNDNQVHIGSKTENLMVNDPSQTIFNIMKIFGHDYDEIINNSNKTHLLWPFKLYRDKYNKPYIIIKEKEEQKEKEKDKIYYFEDILVLFLKKLFNLVFQKITLENKSDDIEREKQPLISLNLVVSIPNCFTYYQRKLLEKIFYTEIFPNNCIYGGYQITLENIGIESRTGMACLCLKNGPKIKINNILIINIDTCSVDISVVSLYDNINQVVASDSIELLEENFVDNFINLCLSLLKKNNINIPKEFLYGGGLLNKIRELSPKIIKELTLKEEKIFRIDNLNNGNGNCILQVNRIEYEKECFELCKKVIILIKKLLRKANLNENDINDIIIIGEEMNMNKLNQMMKELFINNKNIYDKLSEIYSKPNDNNKDYYIVSGTALRAFDINNQVPSCVFKNVCPINIGMEAIDGSMDLFIQKNSILPFNINKIIKVKNNNNDNSIIINIFEGEEKDAKRNRFISQFMFNKKEFKFVKQIDRSEYLELYCEFEIDCYLNIKFYINDDKTYKHLIKREINIKRNEIKGNI